MYLTLSKRFEFNSSVRLYCPDLTEAENLRQFGPGSRSQYGFGNNYVLHVVFHGPVEAATGMMINVATVKERVNKLLAARYDHKFLNVDTKPFDQIEPTPENIARQLRDDIAPLFADLPARPVAVHLEATPDDGATAYADGRVERQLAVEFSAARRTFAPTLSDGENRKLFGAAASPEGHGHNYRLLVTLNGNLEERTGQIVANQVATDALAGIRDLLDHKNLNTQVSELAGHPITTETIARLAFDMLAAKLPVARVRLWELPNFSVEYGKGGEFRMVLQEAFHAAHRLHSKAMSDAANLETYGKCNNPAGHGHRYIAEAAFGGLLDERTGTLFNLTDATAQLKQALKPWAYRHLDIETEEFKERPSTGENIVSSLWPKLEQENPGLTRLRLWETPNNRFTLRRT